MRTLLRIPTPNLQLALVHYTTNHGPHLAHNLVPHQDCIHSRDLENQLTDTTNRLRTDGKTQTYGGGTWIPMPQRIPPGEYNPHLIHAQSMMVAPSGWTRTLSYPPEGSYTDYGDDQQHHDLRIQQC